MAAHDDGAPPALVLETTGGAGDGHRIGSGDGQLPHPGTTYVAYAFQAVDGVAANPGTASFAGASDGDAAFAAVAGDPDDVYAVTLGKGDQLDVAVASLSPDPVAVLLFDPSTEDVFGQLSKALTCGGGAEVSCPTTGLHFEAGARGTYLLDVFSTGSTGGYTLRVRYTGPGGRALLRAWTLTLDEQRPRIADATAAPNPFEPRPGDGDRDSTTFAMTSSERGRLRAVVYRHASTEVVRVLVSGSAGPGGRRRAPCCGGPSPTCSRPPTPPATPPGRNGTACGCCEPPGGAFRDRPKVSSDNGLTAILASGRVVERPAERPSSAGRVSRETGVGRGGAQL